MLTSIILGLKSKGNIKYPARTITDYPYQYSQLLLSKPKSYEGFIQDLFNCPHTVSPKYELTKTEDLSYAGFTVIACPRTSEMKLVKNVKDTIIEISYQGSEIIDLENKEETSRIEFTVTLKGDNTIIFTCSTNKGEIELLDLIYGEGMEEEIRTTEESCSSVDEWDENTKEKYVKYLRGLGITKKIINYIEVSGIDGEQKNYITWLKEIKGSV